MTKKKRREKYINKYDMITLEVDRLKQELKKYDTTSKKYKDILECIHILTKKDSIDDVMSKSKSYKEKENKKK